MGIPANYGSYFVHKEAICKGIKSILRYCYKIRQEFETSCIALELILCIPSLEFKKWPTFSLCFPEFQSNPMESETQLFCLSANHPKFYFGKTKNKKIKTSTSFCFDALAYGIYNSQAENLYLSVRVSVSVVMFMHSTFFPFFSSFF